MWKTLPKRGFTNNFRCEYDNVLLSELDAYIRAGKLDPTRVITIKHMYDAGLLEKKAYNRDGVQVNALHPTVLVPLHFDRCTHIPYCRHLDAAHSENC
ncbi:MAG: mitochondrial large ribosomal subunit protein uL15m [Akkermansiaceae bacterium]|nr:mitochondrial large ribosomal subunit protein uL15m [Akkermansiaceae bacterium]